MNVAATTGHSSSLLWIFQNVIFEVPRPAAGSARGPANFTQQTTKSCSSRNRLKTNLFTVENSSEFKLFCNFKYCILKLIG